MITLLGATGFTGQIIAGELDRAGLPFRIAGRSPDKLRGLSSALQSGPEWIHADADQVSSLPALFKSSQLLVNCAGPFTDLGERVIAQAAMSGCAYLDVANELGYLFKVRGYHEMARKTGARLVPACGFEVALADCAAQLCGQRLQQADPETPLDCVDIIYQLSSASSAGTRRSAVRSLATSWVAYQNREWVGAMPANRRRRFELAAGPVQAFTIPSCESVTVPGHLNVKQINVWMATKSRSAGWVIPLLARLSRSILRPVILKLAARGGQPTESQQDSDQTGRAQFNIDVMCTKGNQQTCMALTGKNPYRLTGKIALYAAQKLLDSTALPGGGFYAPAQVLEPSTFISTARQAWGVEIHEGTR